MDCYPLEETVEMLRKARSLRKVADETGLTERWLYMLLAGTIRDPGVTRVRRLHEHLLAHAQDDEAAA